MKTFRQYLNESKWQHLLYHASYNNFDPNQIKPGNHFGTLKAATARAYATRGPNEKKLQIHAYEYHTTGQEHKMDNHIYHSHNEVAHELKNKGIMDKNEPHSEKSIKNAMTKHNIGSLTYTNHVEDPGSKSHIIYHPEHLKHVHTFNTTNSRFKTRDRNRLKKFD